MSLKGLSAVWRARPTKDFPRGPDEMTMGVICVCLGANLARPVWGWGLDLEGVMTLVLGNLVFL